MEKSPTVFETCGKKPYSTLSDCREKPNTILTDHGEKRYT